MAHHGWVSHYEIQSYEIYTSASEPFTLVPFVLKQKILTSGEKFISSKHEHI